MTQTTTRRRLLTAVAVTPVAPLAVTIPALAAVDPNADAPLFDLSRRLRETYAAINENLGRLADLTERLTSRAWTPEELTEHRIVGKRNETRWLSEKDIAEWQERCAARRALFDAKNSVYDTARIASGIDDIEDKEERLWDEYFDILKLIAICSPTTIPGVLEKMRVFREAYPECFDQPEETMPGAVPVFLSALADFQRLVGTLRV